MKRFDHKKSVNPWESKNPHKIWLNFAYSDVWNDFSVDFCLAGRYQSDFIWPDFLWTHSLDLHFLSLVDLHEIFPS